MIACTDYYLTTIEEIPGDIALQCLQGFSVILRKSVKPHKTAGLQRFPV